MGFTRAALEADTTAGPLLIQESDVAGLPERGYAGPTSLG